MGKFSKLVPPDALKMHSLGLPVLRFFCKTFSKLLSPKRQPHKMVKHTLTIRRQFADKLFECV